jgi:hypothetical protein
MDGTSWLWIALIAFLVFCCIPMLFMGTGHSRQHDAAKESDKNSGR